LRHDFATAVSTFDWKQSGSALDLDGEIIISVQTAKRNALEYDASVKREILLYMIHGILHLCGFDDKSPRQVKQMRDKEKKLLALL
jgi:probable rRNA maturation factor